MVRDKGVEPLRLSALDPKSRASAISANPAYGALQETWTLNLRITKPMLYLLS